MSRLKLAAASALLACILASAMGGELVLDEERDAVSLAGRWELLLDHGDQDVWQVAVAAEVGPWRAVDVPGSNLLPAEDGNREAATALHKKTECVWIRRTFDLDAARASRDAVLRWGGIRFGATAWINGKLATQHVPVGPHTVLLPRGALKAGDNEIVLKIPGWAGVPKSKSGYPLTPTGGATQNWGGKSPAIYNDIWLEFYDRVRLKHVLAMPDVAGKRVTFRVWFDGLEALPETFSLAIDVHRPESAKDASPEVAQFKIGGTPMRPGPRDFTVKLDVVAPWTPETPHLYRADVALSAGGKPCDRVSFRFGMREIGARDGHFHLNGKRLWLRGSNLVNEWLWGEKYNENVKQYIVDEARQMSLNCFRTHTQPPPARWLNVADEHGMMILAEMPLLYNHGDFGYTPEELEVLHRNALLDATGWVTRIWNHPSVILWVLSNESRLDNAWESGPLYRHVKGLDPTRTCMRTGEGEIGTPDMVDVHTCFNVNRGAEGDLIAAMTERMARKDPSRPLTNTEYMNIMWDPAPRWLGREKHPDFPLAYAECAAEHTEAMRRLGFDCLLPYMYAGWTRLSGKMNWRDDYPTPMAAALQSVMSPVVASLETFDRNYVVGATIDAPLVLINETHGKVEAKLDLYVTPRNPLFVPDAEALAAAVWRESHGLTLDADSMRTMNVRVPVPKAEGTYYAAAVITREGHAPVVSQRTLRAVDADKSAEGLKGRRVVVLGGDENTQAFLKRHGCAVVEGLAQGRVEGDVVLIANAGKLSAAEREKATGPLRAFAEAGGRVVILDQKSWPWQELADCRVGLPEFASQNPVICSRAHRFEGAEHAMLRDIPADWLWRWNGLPGAIVNAVVLDGPALEQGRKILWASRPDYTAALSLPVGKGEIVFCQLLVRERLNRDGPTYDPVADRLLANLLGR